MTEALNPQVVLVSAMMQTQASVSLQRMVDQFLATTLAAMAGGLYMEAYKPALDAHDGGLLSCDMWQIQQDNAALQTALEKHPDDPGCAEVTAARALVTKDQAKYQADDASFSNVTNRANTTIGTMQNEIANVDDGFLKQETKEADVVMTQLNYGRTIVAKG